MSVTPVKIGGGFSTTSGQTTIVCSLTTSANAGDDVWVFHSCRTQIETSIADTQSNTWSLDVKQNAGTDDHVGVAHSTLTTGLTAGTDTITITLNGTTTRTTYTVAKVVSGGMASSPFDTSAVATGSTSSVSVGPTATLAQANELAFLAVAVNEAASGESITGGGSLTQLDTQSANAGSAFLLCWVGWQTTTVNSALTLTASVNTTPTQWAGFISTYKIASGGTTTTPLIQPMIISNQSVQTAGIW